MSGHVEDDIFWRCPTVEFTGEVDGKRLWIKHFPGEPGHDFNRIGAPDADGAGAQSPCIGGVRVGANEQLAGKGIGFQIDLVDDASAGFPKTRSVSGCGRFEKVVDFAVFS